MPAKIIKQLVPICEVPVGGIFTKKTGDKQYRRISELKLYNYKGKPETPYDFGKGIPSIPYISSNGAGSVEIQIFPDPDTTVIWYRPVVIIPHADISPDLFQEGYEWKEDLYFIQSINVNTLADDEP